jgi:phosphohistidine swiveling domain-containing protein
MDKLVNLPVELISNNWDKNWSSKWTMSFASLYWCYTTNCTPYFKVNMKYNLLVSTGEGISSNYVAEKDLSEFCDPLVDVIKNDFDFVEKLAKDTIETTVDLLNIINTINLEQSFNLDNIKIFKSKFYEHIPPHFALKKVIDFLPSDLQEKSLPILRNARIKTEKLFDEVNSLLKEYTKLIANENNLSNVLTEFLLIEEIEEYLENKNLPSEKELTLRSKGAFIFCKGTERKVFVGDEYLELHTVLAGENKIEFKGSSGFKGCVKGIARIIFDPVNVNKFDSGDILVTGMTRPEFVPLMEKSAAFVTDAGGLLSHAAIVARELKIPCVLATRNASKIINDGDLIEVDANKGIVKILKKNNKINS